MSENILHQIDLLSRLTGLDPSAFSHVIVDGPVTINVIGAVGDFVLASCNVGPRFALVVTELRILFTGRGVTGDNFFVEFLNNDDPGQLEAYAFMRLNGETLIPQNLVQVSSLWGGGLFVVPPGAFAFGLSIVQATPTDLYVVGRATGFLCPVEAVEKLKNMRTNFLNR